MVERERGVHHWVLASVNPVFTVCAKTACIYSNLLLSESASLADVCKGHSMPDGKDLAMLQSTIICRPMRLCC